MSRGFLRKDFLDLGKQVRDLTGKLPADQKARAGKFEARARSTRSSTASTSSPTG